MKTVYLWSYLYVKWHIISSLKEHSNKETSVDNIKQLDFIVKIICKTIIKSFRGEVDIIGERMDKTSNCIETN